MAYPGIYKVSYSYTGFQQSQGDNSFPGSQIDNDFAGLSDGLENVSNFAKNVIRSDGALKNGIVTYDSLAPNLQTNGLAPAVAWATATTYGLGTTVIEDEALYRAIIPHTSGVFAMDLAAGRWLFLTELASGAPGTPGTNGAGYGGTSATSLSIASGSKVFVTQTGLAYVVGSRVRAASAANSANYMEGRATGYAAGNLTILVDVIGGTGTFTDWNISIAGEPGGLGNFLQAGTGAIPRSYQEKARERISVMDFGAKGDALSLTATVSITSGTGALTATGATFANTDIGKTILVPGAGAAGANLVTTIATFTDATHIGLTVNAGTTLTVVSKSVFYGTDDTAAINAALTYATGKGRAVWMPTATYLIAGTISVNASGVTLFGDGEQSTILISPKPDNPIIVVGNSIIHVRVSDLSLDRPLSVTATSGGDGLQWANSVISDGHIRRVWSRRSFYGFKLGPTALSDFQDIRAENNVSHGVLQTNNAAYGGCQWYSANVYCGSNGGDGWSCRPSGAAVQSMPVGGLTKLLTFGNTGHGFAAIGTVASPIPSVRIIDSFCGQDGASEIYLDTYGSDHMITNSFLELAGTSLTGPLGTTPISGVGHGFEATGNNVDIMLASLLVVGMPQSGIVTAATGKTTINNCWIKNNTNYGIVSFDGTKVVVENPFFLSNTLGNYFTTTNPNRLTRRDNEAWQPYTPVQSGTAPGAALGWFKVIGKEMYLALRFSATGTGSIILSLPTGVTVSSVVSINQVVVGKEVGQTAKTIIATFSPGASNGSLNMYDASSPAVNGAICDLSGVISIN